MRATAKHPRDHLIFSMAGGTGLRLGELTDLNVPTARWMAQQVVEAFPADGSEPRYLLRDRDGIYGSWFQQRVRNMGIRQILISPRSPWQNP